MLPQALDPAKQIKAKPREKEETESTKPKRTLKKGCVTHFIPFHEVNYLKTREEEDNTNTSVEISSDINESDNEILTFRAVNE
jgi:hypothetical protein